MPPFGENPSCKVGPVDPEGVLDHLGLTPRAEALLVQLAFFAIVNRRGSLEDSIEALRKVGMNDLVILVALREARQSGYKVPETEFERKAGVPPVYQGGDDDNGAPSVGAPEYSAAQYAIAKAEELEWQYKKAMANDDTAAMQRIAGEFAALMNEAELHQLPVVEMAHNAPLLREAIYGPRVAGSGESVGPTRPSSGGGGNGPYRTLPLGPGAPVRTGD